MYSMWENRVKARRGAGGGQAILNKFRIETFSHLLMSSLGLLQSPFHTILLLCRKHRSWHTELIWNQSLMKHISYSPVSKHNKLDSGSHGKVCQQFTRGSENSEIHAGHLDWQQTNWAGSHIWPDCCSSTAHDREDWLFVNSWKFYWNWKKFWSVKNDQIICSYQRCLLLFESGDKMYNLIGASPDGKVMDKSGKCIGLTEYKAPIYKVCMHVFLYNPKEKGVS